MTTCVSLMLAIVISSAPGVAPPAPAASPAPFADAPDELPPRVPGRALPTPPLPPPALRPVPEEVSLGAGWAGAEANGIPREAGARVSITDDDVTVWAPPPAWPPPPLEPFAGAPYDRYEGDEDLRALHLGLAIAVESILSAIAIGLVLSEDPDVVDDGRLAPATQSDAFFPR